MAPATATPPQPRTSRVVPWHLLGDEVLARRAAAGSQQAFGALVERYRGPLEGYCRSILLDSEDAGDATQSTFERALRALPDRDAARPLRPWLYRIAHNEAISIIRARRPHQELGPATEPAVPGPEITAEQRERLGQLVSDLRALPERQRGALVMRELNGLGYEEIAQALELTPCAARRAVFDARSALHDAADGREAECVAIRRSLSDGDRRSLRARRIRAHLRACDDCASFGRAMRARRSDLHLLAPWLSGAAIVGVLGLGAGTAGTGAVVATGTGTLAATGSAGVSWAGLPAAAKGLVAAAAIVTTGTAAVSVDHAARTEPRDRPAAISERPPPEARSSRAEPPRAARADRPAQATAPAADRAGSVRAEAGGTRSSAPKARVRRRAGVEPLLPAGDLRPVVDGVTRVPKQVVGQVGPVVRSTEEIVRAALERARTQVLAAFELARRTAGAGTSGALQLAQTTLQRTLGDVRTMLEKVLGGAGLRLPASAATTPQPSPSSSLTAAMKPVQQILGGVQALLERIFGKR